MRSRRVSPSRTSGMWGTDSKSVPDTSVSLRRFRARAPSRSERCVELFLDRDALDLHVLGQAVLVRRVVLALDQRLQIGAALLGDAEAIRGDEIARQLLLDVRDFAQRDMADDPFVGLRFL